MQGNRALPDRCSGYDGDPGLAFGPRRGANGTFCWANGARLYCSNLTANLSASKRSETFKGTEAIAVSRTDDVQAAAAGDASAWTDPVKQGLNRVWS